MAFFRITLLLLLSLRLLGGDGGVLQVIAWGGMLVSRAPEMGVTAAVETTFDGDHPCPLCTAIRKSEKPGEEAPLPENVLAKLKLKDTIPSTDLVIPLLAVSENHAAGAPAMKGPGFARTRRDAPPVPPPQQMWNV